MRKMKKQPKNTTATFDMSPRPKNTMKRGSSAAVGTERKKSTTALTAWYVRSQTPSKRPIGIPVSAAQEKPRAARRRVTRTSDQYKRLLRRLRAALAVASGVGRYKGLPKPSLIAPSHTASAPARPTRERPARLRFGVRTRLLQDKVAQQGKIRGQRLLESPWPAELDTNVGPKRSRVAAKDQEAVGQQDGIIEIM